MELNHSNRTARRAKGNELLSDLTHNEGWGVVKEMATSLEQSLINECLVPAGTEWEAVKKDGNLTAIRYLRTLISTVEERADEYRRAVTPR